MWNIVTDSSCDDIRFEEQREDILYQSVPFYLYTDTKEYVDDGSISVPEMMEDLKKSKTARTSCPSPASFAEAFRKPGDVIAFTISSELSGSFQSAETARLMVEEEEPGKRITVFNTRTDGPSIMLLIRETARMILDGLDYAEIISRIPALIDRTFIVYALSSFDNLIRNGRMSRLTGFLANTLGFWGVGIATPEGTIQIKGKGSRHKKGPGQHSPRPQGKGARRSGSRNCALPESTGRRGARKRHPGSVSVCFGRSSSGRRA